MPAMVLSVSLTRPLAILASKLETDFEDARDACFGHGGVPLRRFDEFRTFRKTGLFLAADLLNVFCPTLIHLLREGKVPFRKVGTHRRVRTEELMNYKRQVEADRRAILAELVA